MVAKTKKKSAVSRKKTKPTAINELSAGLYNEVAACASLQDVRLIQSNFEVQADYFNDVNNNREFASKGKGRDPFYDPQNSIVVAEFDFGIEVKESDRIILECNAKYVVIFTLSKTVDEEAVKIYSKRVGRNAAYPYFRQYAASQSWAAGADLPILPILKTTPNNDPKTNKK